jgi:signal peptidase I
MQRQWISDLKGSSVLSVPTRPRLVVVFVLLPSVLGLAACGGSGKSPATDGSVPVETVTAPSRTITYRIASSAMEPTILCERGPSNPGCTGLANDHVAVLEPAPQIRRLDIVVFNTPEKAKTDCGEGGTFVKRVIGLPGELVHEDKHGNILVKSPGSPAYVKLKEPYLSKARRLADSQHFGMTWRVAPDSYFMMGDNRSESCDSRVWGSVPSRNVIGKVVKIIRPAG